MQVLQPYRKDDTTIVKTVLQRLCLKANTLNTSVMKQRQRTAFPPNYIHSIDSTHMMMTAIECRNRGLSFAGVHDSFWTHAGTIHTMNEVLRLKFLELHDRPLLHELHDQLEVRGELETEAVTSLYSRFSLLVSMPPPLACYLTTLILSLNSSSGTVPGYQAAPGAKSG
jgi:hypothetical protein